MQSNLIAPCGMNCGVCLHYLRERNKCPGCFSGRKVNQKPIKCPIRLCKNRQGEYCFDCNKFPCERLMRLDKRYRERYKMSEIENLKHIKDKGIKNFLTSERKKWISKKGTFCVHDKKYYEK
ncbi:DUF3795 domain-containing protein [Candidatus Kuenenbacteria bacterium]|nr:DUF3795 domain-containing protein [Candidatus Kuenenbacteria bacterium]